MNYDFVFIGKLFDKIPASLQPLFEEAAGNTAL